MAQQPRFEVEDIERLFRALIPSGTEDPFGRIEKLILDVSLDHKMAAEGQEILEERLFEKLDSIENRTFGILFLMIFRTIKIFLGLLPAGRIIIIALAIFTLLSTALETGGISADDIAAAAKKTGLADWLSKVLDDLEEHAALLSTHVEDLVLLTTEMFASISSDIDGTIFNLNQVYKDSLTDPGEDPEAKFARLQSDVLAQAARLAPTGNAANNLKELLGPALQGISKRIREIPDQARQLVDLGSTS